MPEFEIRRFQRADRDQVTGLVNQHIGAVMPGCSVSVNTVLSQLEREPGEPLVDPWVVHREAWAAVHRERVVAAALLHRFADDERVHEGMRGGAEIRWLVALPWWPTGDEAFRGNADHAAALLAHCIVTMRGWGRRRSRRTGPCPRPACTAYPRYGRTCPSC